ADAVSVKLNGNPVSDVTGPTTVSVDPFNAYALNGATSAGGKTGPEGGKPAAGSLGGPWAVRQPR
ncbi:MAG: hypothetical protein ABR562_08330, partial [Thermoplasmatota archaeon]